MKLMSLCVLTISLLIMGVGTSSCSSSCPPKGKWKTDESVGLIGFEVSKCKIQFIAIAVDVDSTGTRYGALFAQEYKERSNTLTLLLPVECTFASDGQFNCQNDRLTLTGKFISENEAEGELNLPAGLEFPPGFDLSSALNFKWSATTVK